MNTKIQKEFTLTIGTNDENATIDDINLKAFEIEQKGNNGTGMRIHIFSKDEENNKKSKTLIKKEIQDMIIEHDIQIEELNNWFDEITKC